MYQNCRTFNCIFTDVLFAFQFTFLISVTDDSPCFFFDKYTRIQIRVSATAPVQLTLNYEREVKEKLYKQNGKKLKV